MKTMMRMMVEGYSTSGYLILDPLASIPSGRGLYQIMGRLCFTNYESVCYMGLWVVCMVLPLVVRLHSHSQSNCLSEGSGAYISWNRGSNGTHSF
jgi:hypothetical protein